MAGGVELKKRRRKVAKMSEQSTALDDYIDQVVQGFDLPGDVTVHRQSLVRIRDQFHCCLARIETFIILQVFIFF